MNGLQYRLNGTGLVFPDAAVHARAIVIVRH